MGDSETIAQDHIQVFSEDLSPRRRPHSLCGQPVPELSHPHNNQVLPDVQMEPPVLHFVSIACPVSGHR